MNSVRSAYRLHMVDVSKCSNFADFLRQLMKAEGLNRKDIEGLLEVSKAMVPRYLTSDAKPGDDKLQLICNRYQAYDIQQLRKMVNGIKEPDGQHAVRTEFGAKVGRLAESIQDETLRFALLQLISSLERDSRKSTGTE